MGSEWAAHKEGFVGNETRFPVGAPPVTSPFLLHANGLLVFRLRGDRPGETVSWRWNDAIQPVTLTDDLTHCCMCMLCSNPHNTHTHKSGVLVITLSIISSVIHASDVCGEYVFYCREQYKGSTV